MRKTLALVGILLFLAACQNSKNNTPEGILSKEEMIDVLVELHFLESSINHENLTVRIRNHYNEIHFNDLYDRLEINKATFDSSLVYYKKDLEEFQEIYDGVYKKLEDIKKDLEQPTSQ